MGTAIKEKPVIKAAQAEPDQVVPKRPIMRDKLLPHGHLVQLGDILVPVGVSAEDLVQDPSLFCMVADQLKPFAILTAVADDGSWCGTLQVVAVNKVAAQTIILEQHKMPPTTLTALPTQRGIIWGYTVELGITCTRVSDNIMIGNQRDQGWLNQDEANFWYSNLAMHRSN